MKKVKKLWMPLVLGVLLMAALVGVAGARPNARPEASPALQDHMISAHHCIPDNNFGVVAHMFFNEYATCTTGGCAYMCPIKPEQGLIRAQRLALYVYDNGAGDVCIWLVHVYPKNGFNGYVQRLVHQCTTNSAADPQVYAYNPANFKVSELQDLYVWVQFTGITQRLYGLKLKYEPL
jgi:hypothetical protein